MLLPHEINIRNKAFSRALNGYSQNEVNAFLDYVAGKYEELYNESIELSGKLDAVQRELDKYQKDEEKREAEIKKLLYDAQRVAAAIIAEAEEKAQKIIDDAENTAKERLSTSAKDQIINDGKLSRLYNEAEKFRAQLISLYEARLRELKKETFTSVAADAIDDNTAVSAHTNFVIDTGDDNDIDGAQENAVSEEEINKEIEIPESASYEVGAELNEENAEQGSAEQGSVEQGYVEQPSEEESSEELLSQDIPADASDGAYIQANTEPVLNENETEPATDNDVPATDAPSTDFTDSEDGSEIEEVLCINGGADTDYSELTPSPYERSEEEVSAYDLYSADSIDDEKEENLPDNLAMTYESVSDDADIESKSSLADTGSFEFVVVDDSPQTEFIVPEAEVSTDAEIDIPDITDTTDDEYKIVDIDIDTDEAVSTGIRDSSENEIKSDSVEGDTPFDDFTLGFLSQGADDNLAIDNELKEDEIEDISRSAAEEKDIDTSDSENVDNAVVINEEDINDVGDAVNIQDSKETSDINIKGRTNGINNQLYGENDSGEKDVSGAAPAATDTSKARRVYRIRRSFKYPRSYVDAASLQLGDTAVNNKDIDDDDLVEQLKQRYPESRQPAGSSVSINKSFDEYDLLFNKK